MEATRALPSVGAVASLLGCERRKKLRQERARKRRRIGRRLRQAEGAQLGAGLWRGCVRSRRRAPRKLRLRDSRQPGLLREA